MNCIYFNELSKPVFFENCPKLFQEIQHFFYLWSFQEKKISSIIPKNGFLIQGIENEQKGYKIHTLWNNKISYEPTISSLLCNFSIELILAFCQEHSDILCIHAAAIQIKNNTILILGNNKSGKSTLISTIMAHGAKNLGDDLIGITPQREVYCFGIPPRLRLPLPKSILLENFSSLYHGNNDEFYQYLYPPKHISSSFGITNTITHIIMLERNTENSAQLLSLTKEISLSEILTHYILLNQNAQKIFQQATKLIENLPSFSFNYSDLDAAAIYLYTFFSENSYKNTVPYLLEQIKRYNLLKKNTYQIKKVKKSPLAAKYKKNEKNIFYIQSPKIIFSSIYEKSFLIDKNSNAIFELNQLSEIIWKLFENPLNTKEAIDLLIEAFPNTSKTTITQDIINIFSLFKQKNFIIPFTH